MRLKIILFFILITYIAKAQFYPIFDNKNIGYIDSLGNIVVPCEYDAEVVFYKFSVKNKQFVNFTIPHWAHFNNNSLTLKTNQFNAQHIGNIIRYSLLDNKGNEIIKNNENKVYGLADGLAVNITYQKTFQKIFDSSYTYIDIETMEIKDKKYDFATSFYNGLALVLESDKYYFINKNFEQVFKELVIEDAKGFSDGLAAVKLDTLWGFIDKYGDWKIKPKYKVANSFNNGKAKVMIGTTFEYIDKDGKIIDEELNYSDGLAVMEHNGKYVFVDANKNIVINERFDYAVNFENGLAKVWTDNELYYINKKGKKIHAILKQTLYKKILNSK